MSGTSNHAMARFDALQREGEKHFKKVVKDMNAMMPFAYEGTDKDEPKYRTLGAWREILLALALHEEKSTGRNGSKS